MKESELYEPIKGYLQASGYVVTGEVKDCDLVARKDDDLVAIELKTGANMTLLIQSIQSLSHKGRFQRSMYQLFLSMGLKFHTCKLLPGMFQLQQYIQQYPLLQHHKCIDCWLCGNSGGGCGS